MPLIRPCFVMKSFLEGNFFSLVIEYVLTIVPFCIATILGESSLRRKASTCNECIQLFLTFQLDFSALENLLNLFARLLPFYTASKERHNDYIRDVFSSEYLGLECSKMCLDLLDGVGVDDWDETCTKLIDIVAQSDISLCVYPFLNIEIEDMF